MKIYLVGGAVRDTLLGRPIRERDWVVVGGDVQKMLSLGYQRVGKSFPVFLHPETKEEYALARTERKMDRGYQGFVCATKAVTLEEDLSRRDLTINAIAKDENGVLFDPYHGQGDLQARCLRHVSPAFVEDPVRILRIARFSARFGDFHIAKDTRALMKTMVHNGEVDALMPERVWQEWMKALLEPNPERFLIVLHECGALNRVLPELNMLLEKSNPNPMHHASDWRAETNFKKCVKALHRALDKDVHPKVRFAIFTHQLSFTALKSLNKRLKLPRDYFKLVAHLIKYYRETVVEPMNAMQWLNLLNAIRAFTDLSLLDSFFEFSDCLSNDNFLKALKKAYHAGRSIEAQEVIADGFKGSEIRDEMNRRRMFAIEQALENRSQSAIE